MIDFFKNINNETRVIDFQLIYDCQSKLHLELYGIGLKKESLLIDHKDIYSFIDYGFLECSEKNYQTRLNMLKSICKDYTKLHQLYKKVELKMNKLDILNNYIEEKIKSNIFDISDYIVLADTFTTIMAFRRIPEIFFDVSKKYTKENLDLTQNELPSFMNLLNEQMNFLHCKMSDNELEDFAFNYGYLASFYMTKTKLEDVEYVRKISKKNKPSITKTPNKILVNKSYEIDDIDLKMFYLMIFYEERRHMAQMRVLRNFRLMFEHYDMDPFSSLIEDLLI